MKWVFLILIAVVGGAFAFAALASVYQARKELRTWRAPVRLLAGALGLMGAIGFFGAAFSAVGGLDWLGSFEWPVGRASGVVTLLDGTHVVPHTPTGRIQLYDANRRFLRGWRIDASGGIFTPRVNAEQQIEIDTARGDLRLVYDAQGKLISRTQYDDGASASRLAAPADARTMVIPTAWYAWPLTSPFYAWLCVGAAIAIWAVLGSQALHARRGEVARRIDR